MTALAAPPTRNRLLRDVAAVLIISGALLLLDAAVTLVWQEPLTALIGAVERGQISQRFLTQPLTPVDKHVLARLPDPAPRLAYLARRLNRVVTPGAAVGRLAIPRIGLRTEVVQGTDPGSLERGPGHYPGTALPGLGQTVAIAGHRTTYLAPFRRLDALKAGDPIVVRMPYGRFTYAVQFSRIVAPTALWVTRNVGYDRLVLTACNPLYSAAQRIVVFARLRSAVARF